MTDAPKRTTVDLSVFIDCDEPLGLIRIAPSAPAKGPMLSARQRRDADRSSTAAT
jgi:hypothetical protein